MKTTLVLCICGVMGMAPVNGQDARCPGGEGKIAATVRAVAAPKGVCAAWVLDALTDRGTATCVLDLGSEQGDAPCTLTLAKYAAGTGEFKMNVGSRIYTRPDAVFAILSA